MDPGPDLSWRDGGHGAVPLSPIVAKWSVTGSNVPPLAAIVPDPRRLTRELDRHQTGLTAGWYPLVRGSEGFPPSRRIRKKMSALSPLVLLKRRQATPARKGRR